MLKGMTVMIEPKIQVVKEGCVQVVNRATYWASWVAQLLKNLPAVQETLVQLLGREDPWRRARQPIPVFSPGESHGQRRLVG